MFALGLLTCAVLTAFSAHAEVVHDFNRCKNFFYKNKEPGGLDQNAKTICQVYGQSTRYYYATLYSTEHRIPLYSAYVLDRRCLSDRGRTDSWHVEPQISGYPHRNMVREGDLRNLGLNEDVIKRSQAMSSDYKRTGYDRGHLNPSSFNCGDGRRATFTLTNAAPMDPSFNRGLWKNREKTLRSDLLNQLSSDGGLATAYIVTGTVPNANLRIPQKEVSEEPGRVTVPSHVWTAVCYKHATDNSKSFSFGYMGENQPEESGLNQMSVSDLEYQLSRLYSQRSGTQRTVSIIYCRCTSGGKPCCSSPCLYQHDLKSYRCYSGQTLIECSPRYSLVTVKGKRCLDDHPCATYGYDYYWCKTDHGYIKDSWDHCSPPLWNSKAKNGKYCRSNHACAKYDEDYMWCYTDDKGSYDECCTSDDCYSTVNGKTCRSNHKCGYHGERYLWCYTDNRSNWDYCCTDCA